MIVHTIENKFDILHNYSMWLIIKRKINSIFIVFYGILLLLLLKNVGSARLGESDIHPISPQTPAPQYQPIDRKKRKGKRVEDYSRDRAA